MKKYFAHGLFILGEELFTEDGFYIFTVDFKEEKEREKVQALIESIVMHKEVRTKAALLPLNQDNVSKKNYFIKHGEKLNK